MLGEGGMGAVYKARDLEVDRVVALKVIRPEYANRTEILARFKQELVLARQITHRNVIRIFDLGQADGIRFITMEYVDGQDLYSLLRSGEQLTLERKVKIAREICRALEAAHEQGVVHRDLKPQNIMVENNGRVLVMDFGIARSMEDTGLTTHRCLDRNAGLHVSGTGQGRETRYPLGSVFVWRDLLRNAHRQGALRGRDRRGTSAEAGSGAARASD